MRQNPIYVFGADNDWHVSVVLAGVTLVMQSKLCESMDGQAKWRKK